MRNVARKKIVINDQELTPTVLAVVKDKKKTSIFSMFWLVFIFAIFIAGVIYLPEIAAEVNNYLNPESISPTKKPTSNNQDVDKEDGSTVKEVYLISENPELKIDTMIVVKNIEIKNNKISLVVVNVGKENIFLDKYDYFLTLHDNSKKLLQRIILNEGIIATNNSISLIYDLKDASATYVSLVSIPEESYPAYTAVVGDDGNAMMSCVLNDETVDYYFKNNLLYSISDVYKVEKNNVSYTNLYSMYEQASANYNNIIGIDSSVTQEIDALYFRTNINLDAYVPGSFVKNIIFSKDQDAKVVKFEMEAKGFACK